MSDIEQEQKEKAEEALLEAKTEEQAHKAFAEAVRHISTLTPRERARLRSKERKRKLRLNLAEKRAAATNRLAKQKVAAAGARKSRPFTFMFSPNMHVTAR